MQNGMIGRSPVSVGATATLISTVGLLLVSACASTPPVVGGAARTSSGGEASGPDAAASDNARPKPGQGTNLTRSFDEAVARGDEAWRSGQAEMAIYLYIQALSFRPRDVPTLCKIGVIEQGRGDLVSAQKAFGAAAEGAPHDARITAHLGLLDLTLGRDAEARTWLQRSDDAGSADWRVYDGLGVAYRRLGDPMAAESALKKAVDMAPGVATPLVHRGEAQLDSGDYAGAESTLRAALAIGKSPEAVRLLGEVQARRRDYTDSIDNLLQVMDAPKAYGSVARQAMANGDNEIALRYFDKASSLSPVYSAETQRDAAVVRERLGERPE